MWIDQPVSGGAWIDEDDYLAGAPELLVEVAASTASIDLGDKKRAYQRIGVQEYLVLQVYEQKASWFRLQDGEYQAIPADAQGVLRSVLFPGLWLDPAKFWAADLSGLIATVQQGLTSPEHGAFVEQLKQ
jgi:Uma2 family endonuclease